MEENYIYLFNINSKRLKLDTNANSVKPDEGFDKESITKTKQTEELVRKYDAKLVEEEGPLQFLIDVFNKYF